MPNTWPTFWCEPTGLVRVSLRRFTFGVYPETDDGNKADHVACPAMRVDDRGYQQGHGCSLVILESAPRRMSDDGYYLPWPVDEFREDQWPTTCEACGEACADGWYRQANQDEWYRADGVGQWTQRDLPVGAMFDASWLRKGPDGIGLMVVCPPGGLGDHWAVDARASNCGLSDDDDHYCWCRHGNPRSEPVTVDKECVTCVAGAGSIQTGSWHGFLRSGQLVEC